MKSCGSDCILARSLCGRIVADIIPGPFRPLGFGKNIDINGRATSPNYQIVVGYHPHFCYFKLFFFPYVWSKIKNLCWQNLLMGKSHLFGACRGSSNELAMATRLRRRVTRGGEQRQLWNLQRNDETTRTGTPRWLPVEKKARPGRQKCPELWMGFRWNSDLRF